jgi:surface polysaccharide O-acyltransferase-like enzyme
LKRDLLPDVLKGIAVFLIIPVHILETFINYPGRESLFGKTILFLGGPIAVPIFMMVMGYFIAANKKSLRQNSLRGLKIFGLGFLLNIGLNFNLLIKIKFQNWNIDPFQYIFGVDIFYLAGISILVLSLLKLLKKSQILVLLILIIFVSASTNSMNDICMSTNRNYILAFIAGKYSWSYFPIFPWLTYPLLGFLIQKIEKPIRRFFKNQKPLSYTILFVLLILVIYFAPFGIKTSIDLESYYHHNFYFFLWATSLTTIWIVLIQIITKKFENSLILKFLQWLGKNITVFYVIQWLIIGNIATEIYQTQNLSSFFFWFGGIFIITSLLSLLYTEKIRNKLKKTSR